MSKKHEIKLRFRGIRYPNGNERFRYEILDLPKTFKVDDELGVFLWKGMICTDCLDKLEVDNKDQLKPFAGELVQSQPKDDGTEWWNAYVEPSDEMLLAQLEGADTTKATASVQQIVHRRKANKLSQS